MIEETLLDVSKAYNVLRKAIQEDPAYAWSWHCNIAMCCQDAGATHTSANEGAARFMKLAFDVDSRKLESNAQGNGPQEKV